MSDNDEAQIASEKISALVIDNNNAPRYVMLSNIILLSCKSSPTNVAQLKLCSRQ